jgi:hypothetical protein
MQRGVTKAAFNSSAAVNRHVFLNPQSEIHFFLRNFRCYFTVFTSADGCTASASLNVTVNQVALCGREEDHHF